MKLLTTLSHYDMHTFLAVPLKVKWNGRCGSTNACKYMHHFTQIYSNIRTSYMNTCRYIH